MNINRLAKQAQRFISENSPLILTTVGVVGSATTAVLAVKATFKAADKISKERVNRKPTFSEQELAEGVKRDRAFIEALAIPDLETKEKIKLVWMLYLPTAGSLAVTSGAIIFAHRISMQRLATMAGMYSLTERAYSEYADKVKEKFGIEEEQKVRQEALKDKANRTEVPKELLADPLTGFQLMLDGYTGRYFWGTKALVLNAAAEIYDSVNHSSYATLSEFYGKIGLDDTSVSDEFGWNTENPIELSFVPVEKDDGRTALAFEFKEVPIYRPDVIYNRDEVFR